MVVRKPAAKFGRILICGDTGHAALLEALAHTLRERGHSVERGPVDTPGIRQRYDTPEAQAVFRDIDVAVFTIRHDCSRGLMESASRLRGVVYPTIGVETLDMDAANQIGIAVGHGAVRGNVVGMAEATIMLMLMLFYDVELNMAILRSGRWRRPGHHSRSLEGKTIGIIGFGRIAKMIAARLDPFDVRILTYSPRARTEDLPVGVEKVELDDLLRQSDLVSILTGLTDETRHMLNAPRIALMKPTAYIVNTGRGAVIDERALVEALADKRIAGAAIDTFETEPLPLDNPLRAFDNVILTPHTVGHTVEGWAEFLPTMVENIERMLAGTMPLYCANVRVEEAWRARIRAIDALCGA